MDAAKKDNGEKKRASIPDDDSSTVTSFSSVAGSVPSSMMLSQSFSAALRKEACKVGEVTCDGDGAPFSEEPFATAGGSRIGEGEAGLSSTVGFETTAAAGSSGTFAGAACCFWRFCT